VKLSLSQRIIIPSSAVFVLLQLSLAACMLDHERNSLMGQLDARAARLATYTGPGAIHGSNLGETLLEQGDVAFCEVKSADGQMLFRGGTADARHSRRYSFPVILQAESDGENGTLSLALSTAAVDHAVTEARSTIIVAILANTALAAFIVALIVRRTIGNSVTRLLKQVRVVSAGRLRYPTLSQDCDELAQLAEMVNTMAAQLQATTEKERIPANQVTSAGRLREQAMQH
jgi:methyl-accepting chemotaxis protein